MISPDQIARNLVAFLQARRWPLSDEKALQAAIAAELAEACFAAEREVRLSATDVVDFMVEGVAVEIKIKGSKRNIYRQCARYCSHERVRALVLATNFKVGMPPERGAKPCYVADLGRGWL